MRITQECIGEWLRFYPLCLLARMQVHGRVTCPGARARTPPFFWVGWLALLPTIHCCFVFFAAAAHFCGWVRGGGCFVVFFKCMDDSPHFTHVCALKESAVAAF